jgi:hypothetical protein
MKLDPVELRQQYESLSDEALLAMKRGDLVDLARQVYDEEVESRGLGSPPEAVESGSAKLPENESGEELVEAAVYESRSEARLAKSFLLSAEIPCTLENELALGDAPLRLLVPASMLDQAMDVLGAEISEEELAAQAEAAGEPEPEKG